MKQETCHICQALQHPEGALVGLWEYFTEFAMMEVVEDFVYVHGVDTNELTIEVEIEGKLVTVSVTPEEAYALQEHESPTAHIWYQVGKTGKVRAGLLQL